MWHCEVYDENGMLAMEMDVESPSWRNGRAPECVNVPRPSQHLAEIEADYRRGKVSKYTMVDILQVPLAYVRWPRDGDTPTAIYYMRER
jgi:hypothetical protein